MNTNTAQHDAFEKWLTRTNFFNKLKPNLNKNSVGDYYSYNVNDRWLAWKAAVKHMENQNVNSQI